jgi:hypothetical protein
MTRFNSDDRVHVAAKEFRDVKKAMFEHKYELGTPEFRSQVRSKKEAVDLMALDLRRNHNTTDAIHNYVYQYLRGILLAAGNVDHIIEQQRRENELLAAVELGMVEAGMPIHV